MTASPQMARGTNETTVPTTRRIAPTTRAMLRRSGVSVAAPGG
jgi:hypothetical protein